MRKILTMNSKYFSYLTILGFCALHNAGFFGVHGQIMATKIQTDPMTGMQYKWTSYGTNMDNMNDGILLTNGLNMRSMDNFGNLRKMILDKQIDKNPTTSENKQPVEELTDLRKLILDKHNEYRAKHGAEPLILDEELNQSSQKHAEDCLTNGMLRHSGLPGIGENVYNSMSGDSNQKFSPTEPVEQWYDEIKTCDFNSGVSCILSSGHFTQVVWKSSKKLGVGITTGRNGGSQRYVVCQYDPPGNTPLVNEFLANVSPPI